MSNSFVVFDLLAWVSGDIIFLLLIVALLCSVIYNRFTLGKDNELATALSLENAKVVLLALTVAYLWGVFLLSDDISFFFTSTFFSNTLSLVAVKAFVVFCALLVLILTESFFLRQGRGLVAEWPVFLLIAVYASFGVIQAGDLMTMVLFMEMLSYSLFVMPILYKITNLSLEAMLKYFILGSFASAFLLMGTSLVYATFGTVSYESLYLLMVLGSDSLGALMLGHSSLEDYPFVYGMYLNLGFVFVFSALFFKLGLFPFHYWIRDVYEGSPLPIVAFFATVVKIPVVLVLIKLVFLLMHAMWGYSAVFWLFLEGVGLASILYGTFYAYYQTRLKSLLAVSGIINMGYITLALSLHSVVGVFVATSYLVTYCFITLGLFFVLLSFSSKKGPFVRLTDVAVVLRTHGLLGWLFAVTLLSAAGMPPLPGFFSKLFVLWAFCAQGNYAVAFLLLLANVANFILYIRLIRFMYFFSLRQELLQERINLQELDTTFVVFLVFCYLGSLFFGILVPLWFWKYIAIMSVL